MNDLTWLISGKRGGFKSGWETFDTTARLPEETAMKCKSLMLIDDDEDDQEIFMAAIGQVNSAIRCRALSDAGKAFDLLANNDEEPDLIFLDLNMPGMNGLQFLTEIKLHKKLSEIPVIIFSTTSQPSAIEHTRSLGAHDFITKPNRYEDLINTLKKVVQ